MLSYILQNKSNVELPLESLSAFKYTNSQVAYLSALGTRGISRVYSGDWVYRPRVQGFYSGTWQSFQKK